MGKKIVQVLIYVAFAAIMWDKMYGHKKRRRNPAQK